MEINDQSLSFLHEMLLKILSSDNNTRKSSETYLKSIELQEGYSILVLTLIKHLVNSINPQDIAIRQSASILFKNLIKNHWNNDNDNDDNTTILINDKDKELIKVHVVELMCVVSNDVQNQLAESITIISKYDFPKKWMNLLPQLIEKLNVNDINITKGVMLTANSIMKRFRYVFRSDELYSEILICLKYFQIPLLQQFQYYTNTLLIQYSNNKTELIITIETTRLISRIFFSLNWQDIPEFFEDNVSVWMTEFTKYLTYTNILLIDDNEDNESGPIEKLQSAIIDNINLYANKYEDIFEPFLSQFTQLIWKLLIEISIKTKYDILAVSSIKFLISVSSKEMNSNLFTVNILKDIVEQIIVKNITVTDNDEELFDDNPIDYISKDMEGNDQDTRRRCAIELIRSLLKFHLIPMTELCLTYINAMLTHYHTTNDWKAKDAALNLILAVSVKSSNNLSGAGTLNTNINILSIFEIHVLPEIQQQQQNLNNYINHHPIVKADAIKLVCLFRSHLPKQLLLSIIPFLIQFMYSKYIVIQTYAAMTIERFLCIKDKISIDNSNSSGSTKTINRITKDDILPYIESLFNGLFSILDNVNQPDNEYVMMCVMRCLLILSNDNNNNIITSITELILLKLTNYLDRICKNPINPYYNHYLFESIALLIRSCCNTTTTTTTNSSNNQEVILIAASRFEILLFPLFQSILAQDVTEFIPYVFQILAQLLCIRPINSGYSEAYKSLFPPLLSPSLWERKGNVPALTDLFIAYISRGMNEIIENNYITGVLGVFQKLLSSKATEVYSFKILNALYIYNPISNLTPYLTTIMNLLLHRLQESNKDNKISRYSKLFFHSYFLLCSIHGSIIPYEILESITSGLFSMLILNIFVFNQANCVNNCDDNEIKEIIIGSIKCLIEGKILTNNNNNKMEVWLALFHSVRSFIDKSSSSSSLLLNKYQDVLNNINDEEDVLGTSSSSLEFDNTYSKLAYATITILDPCQDIKSTPFYFASSLSSFLQQGNNANQLLPLIAQSLDPQSYDLFQASLTQQQQLQHS